MSSEHIIELGNIDNQISEIMLAGEREGARQSHQRQQWSPELRIIGRTL